MMRAIRAASFAFIGVTLSTAGITIADWQLYVVLCCAAAACTASERVK